MKRVISLILSVVLCLIIGIGYLAGTKEEAGADNGFYGKYYSSRYPEDYLELKPDSSFFLRVRERTPSGVPGKNFLEVSGSYEIKGESHARNY